MALSRALMLQKMQARDAAWDGRFITGVLSTGIYCLPSCRARNPKPENVRFFPGLDEARAHGLRACKRCRPDDFYAQRNPDLEAIEALVERMRQAPGDFVGVADLARASKLGTSKLSELFRRHFHTTPARALAAARVGLARRRLIESEAPVSEIAFDAGFESLSSFNANFRRAARLSPSAYRALRGAKSFRVSLPRSFPLERTLAHLARDPESRTERVDGTRFEGGLWLGRQPARLEVAFGAGVAEGRLRARGRLGARAASLAHRFLLNRLGLASDPTAFERATLADPRLAPLVADRRGLRVPRLGEPFECLAWTVVGQQISLPFARRLFGRLTEMAGRPVGDGLYAPPRAVAVAELPARKLIDAQFSQRKAEYLLGAARDIRDGRLDLDALGGGSATRAEERLLAVRGLGPWSVHYLMMRAYGFEDCVPVGDAGLVRALARFFQLEERPGPRETLSLMEPFRPYRTLATFHLWTSLEDTP